MESRPISNPLADNREVRRPCQPMCDGGLTYPGSSTITGADATGADQWSAEQSETWFANRTSLSRHFDVKVPEILVYDGASLHDWIDSGGDVTIDYLAGRLARFLDEFVQRPPYDLVGSSLGSQVALTYATPVPGEGCEDGLDLPFGLSRR